MVQDGDPLPTKSLVPMDDSCREKPPITNLSSPFSLPMLPSSSTPIPVPGEVEAVWSNGFEEGEGVSRWRRLTKKRSPSSTRS